MAFKTKTDCFGLATATKLEVADCTVNKTASVADGRDATGSIVATEVYGTVIAPSSNYKVEKSIAFEANAIKLGAVTNATFDGTSVPVMLGSVTINTSAGGEPAFSASGQQVEDGAATGHYYAVPAFTLDSIHHAQTLFDAFTVSGEGCHLANANYTIACDIVRTMLVGVPKASDVTNGRIEIQITVSQTGTVAPTITPGDGWTMTAPVSETNPEQDFASWTCTLRKALTHAVSAS